MIRVIEGKVASHDIIQNLNKCIVHFLDIGDTTTIKEYLELSWVAGYFGANHIYFINHFICHMCEQANLDFAGLLDFQRLHLVKQRPLV